MPSPTDERYMDLALRLARRAAGQTAPNPAVGAAIVRGGEVVGRGFHRRAGAPHAETEALRQAGRRARGGTLYVTLEPCTHVGRTGPCCDAVLAAGIRRVVVAMPDPNPLTNGGGLRRLRRAGLSVVTGVRRREAERLNEPFIRAMRTGLPLLIAKVGQSLDGNIATVTGQSQWITSAPARRLAHAWRSRVDAILVGVNTILRDDPRLSARTARARSGRPVKVIVDSWLRTPPSARCLSPRSAAPTLIATTRHAPARRRAALEHRGANVLAFPPQQRRVPLTRLCRELVRRGLHTVLVEGGGEVLASAFAERLVGRVVWFVAPRLLGGRTAPSALAGAGVQRLRQAVRLTDLTWRQVGPDLCVEARVMYPRQSTRSDQ